MDGTACPQCRDLLKRNADLEAQVTELTRKLEESQRAGKRQAAPFRKGPPKSNPKTPGRKPNDGGRHAFRPPPSADQVDECHDACLPDECPHCHGHLMETEVAEQFQTEIPRKPLIRKFHVHIGRCNSCGKRVQGRHPLQTSDALGAAASQVGPDAQAAATILHTQMGLSYGKVSAVFDTLFSINLTRGAGAQINLRAATRLESDYQLILEDVSQSKRITPDETGWRIGGHPAWLHVWVGDRATAYAIDSQRSADALERVIGRDWSGFMCHDGYSTYDRFTNAIHQQCVGHLLRRAEGLLSVAKGGAVHFPRQVIDLFREAVHWRNEYHRGVLTLGQLEDQRDVFDDRLNVLLSRPRQVAAHATLAKHLWNHFEEWFTFVFNPDSVEATNWEAEHAVRPAVVNRKVCGGNRTSDGGKGQGILMSVMETCRRQSHVVLDYISQTLRSVGSLLVPRPKLLPRR
jgi:transposase